MPSATLRQKSFRAGEVSPTLYGRDDLDAYQHAVRRSRNGIITRHGTWTNRPGTSFIAEAWFGDAMPSRLVPFNFANGQNYVLEFGHMFVRFYADGGIVMPSPNGWSGVTTYEVGDLVRRDAPAEDTVYRCIQGGNLNHVPESSPDWWAVEANPLYVSTPYTGPQVATLKFAQSGDIITICSPYHAPYELVRTGNPNRPWTIGQVDFSRPYPGIRDAYDAVPTYAWVANPEDCYVEYDHDLATAAPTKLYNFAISRVVKETATGRVFETHALDVGRAFGLKDATHAPAWDPGVNYLNQWVRGSDNFVYFNAQPAGNQGIDPAARPQPAQWSYEAVGSRNFTAYGDAIGYQFSLPEHKPKFHFTFQALPAGFTQVGWRMYQGQGKVKGLLYIAETAELVNDFVVDGSLAPDFAISPPGPESENPMVYNLYPEVVAFCDQRRFFAKGDRILASKLGDYYDFTRPRALLAESPLDFNLATIAYEEVRWLASLRALLAGTNLHAPWAITGAGGAAEAISALSLSARPQSRYGSSRLDPILIGNAMLTVQELGNLVREVAFDFQTDGYQSNELSVMAQHLLAGEKTIDAWTYAQVPHSIVWSKRSDGVLLGVTYNRELEVVAWHWHDTDGEFMDVCSIEEGSEHAVYAIVRRPLAGGGYSRYIERFASREVTDARLGLFLDSALSYDGRAGYGTLTVTGAAGYAPEAEVAIAANTDVFLAGDVGNDFILDPDAAPRFDADDKPLPPLGPVRLRVTAYTGPRAVTAVVVEPAVPAELQGVATSEWARAVDELSGLDHLEGKTVNALADGNVVEDLVVQGGAVTLPTPAAIIHVGLPYVSELELLDVAHPSAELRGKQKTVKRVAIDVELTRGIRAGRDLEHLTTGPGRAVSDGYGPVKLFTGTIDLLVSGPWAKDGRAALQQKHPLPVTVLGVTREVDFGGT